MIKDLFRLALGLLVLGFHRQIAEFMLARERRMADALYRRGWNLPTFPSDKTATDVYFCLGALICGVALLRLWLSV
jgi:hypothetical protein